MLKSIHISKDNGFPEDPKTSLDIKINFYTFIMCFKM